MQLIFVILSIILFWFSPEEYSYPYCSVIHVLYLFNAIILLVKDSKREIIGFNLLFTISFYFVNFVYPLYVYPLYPDYSLFRFAFNPKVITSSTALALVAYSLYAYAYSNRSKGCSHFHYHSTDLPRGMIKLILFMTSILFMIFIGLDGLDYYSEIYLQGSRSTSPIVKYIIVLLNPLIILSCLMIFFTRDKNIKRFIFLFSLGVAVILLFTGTRTLPLALLIILFIYIANARKLSHVKVIFCILVGVVGMSLVGMLRGGDIDSLEYSDHWFGFMEDLIVNNRNLYVIYDFVSEYGILWGVPFLGPLLSAIPMLQSMVMNLLGIPYQLMSSPDFITFMEFGDNPPLGLGSNIVADVYLSFGFVGVVVAFYALGYFISEMRNRMRYGKLYPTLIYYIMVSESIYMCRSTYLSCFRTLVWALIIVYVLNRVMRCPLNTVSSKLSKESIIL